MSYYLLQATYSSFTWIYRVTKDPEDFKRPPDLGAVFEEVGAKVHGIWYSFGAYDLVAIIEVPSSINMATLTIAVRAGWDGKAFDAVNVTPLLTQDEVVAATAAAARALPKSRDATKSGPLTGHMDYENANFTKKAEK